MNLSLRRRVAIPAILALTAAGIAGCSTPAPDPGPTTTDAPAPAELTKVSVSIPPSVFAASLYYGVAEGIFEDAGFEVELAPATSMAEAVPLLLSGELDYIFADLHNTILAASEGLPLVAGAPLAQNSDTEPADRGFANLVVTEESGITSLADLAGKRIGTNSINGQAQLDNTTYLESKGVDTSGIEWIALPTQQAVAALRQGQIDAYTLAEPAASAAYLEGGILFLGSADAAIPGAPAFVLATVQATIDADPDQAKRFQDAVTEANRATNANPATVKELLAEKMQVPIAVFEQVTLPRFAEAPFTPAQTDPVVERLVRLELIETAKVPDIAKLLPLS